MHFATTFLLLASILPDASSQQLRGNIIDFHRKLFDLEVPHEPLSSRIIGGTPVQTPYDWFVQGPNGNCGASLIGSNLVLTAAHCAGSVGGPYKVGETVYIGNTQINDPNAEKIKIKKVFSHPSYNGDTLNYDYMLLLLEQHSTKTPVQLNPNVLTQIQELTVMGFGVTNTATNEATDVLLEVKVDLVPDAQCNSAYGGINAPIMLCAARNGKDSCQGDSGGPIIDASGRQVGVVSFGIGCAQPSHPGVYAEVAGQYDWIVSTSCTTLGGSAPFCGGSNPAPTPAPTSAPTPAPTPSPPANGANHKVVVTVTHDQYPAETGWSLIDPSGNAIAGMSQAPNTVQTQGAVVSKEAIVPAGTYTFKITDAYGDGICCSYGQGNIKITVDGVVVSNTSAEFQTTASYVVQVGGSTPANPTPSPTAPLPSPTPSPTLAPTPQPTNAPSNSPTNAPTPPPTPASTPAPQPGAHTVTVIVQHDNYPAETKWTLRNEAGQVFASQPFNSGVSPGQKIVKNISVPSGSYKFEIVDEYRDGVCCEYGQGYFKIKVDGNQVVSNNGQFGEKAVESFNVGSISTPPPPNDAPPSNVKYEMQVKMDNYPNELGFVLKEGSNVIISSSTVSMPGALETKIFNLNLNPGSTYTLQLTDSYGDGICCQEGNGFVEVYALVDGVKQQLVDPVGDFGSSATRSFTVSSSITSRSIIPRKPKKRPLPTGN